MPKTTHAHLFARSFCWLLFQRNEILLLTETRFSSLTPGHQHPIPDPKCTEFYSMGAQDLGNPPRGCGHRRLWFAFLYYKYCYNKLPWEVLFRVQLYSYSGVLLVHPASQSFDLPSRRLGQPQRALLAHTCQLPSEGVFWWVLDMPSLSWTHSGIFYEWKTSLGSYFSVKFQNFIFPA